MSERRTTRTGTVRILGSSYPVVRCEGESFDRPLDTSARQVVRTGDRVAVVVWAGERLAYLDGAL